MCLGDHPLGTCTHLLLPCINLGKYISRIFPPSTFVYLCMHFFFSVSFFMHNVFVSLLFLTHFASGVVGSVRTQKRRANELIHLSSARTTHSKPCGLGLSFHWRQILHRSCCPVVFIVWSPISLGKVRTYFSSLLAEGQLVDKSAIQGRLRGDRFIFTSCGITGASLLVAGDPLPTGLRHSWEVGAGC